jgi:hypothetical protein
MRTEYRRTGLPGSGALTGTYRARERIARPAGSRPSLQHLLDRRHAEHAPGLVVACLAIALAAAAAAEAARYIGSGAGGRHRVRGKD